MSLKVVPLHDGRPSLNDIPARLRLLAEEIERGDFPGVDGAIVLLPLPDDYPVMFGYGNVEGRNDPVIQLEMAKMNFIINVARRG